MTTEQAANARVWHFEVFSIKIYPSEADSVKVKQALLRRETPQGRPGCWESEVRVTVFPVLT